jgi:LPPG:FO 2-phospho-L-lactate transferase
MRACGYEASALGVAQCYGDFLDALLVANEDRNLIPAIEQLRIRATTSDIFMPNLVEKRRLSRELLALAQK